MSTNAPPVGLLRRARYYWRRFRCPHKRIFWMYLDGLIVGPPDEDPKNIMSVGYCAAMSFCDDCGAMWGDLLD